MELEATIVGKYSAVSPVLDERSRRLWAASEAAAIGYGGDALVSSATGLARETIRKGRREIARGEPPTSRIRAPGAGRPGIEHVGDHEKVSVSDSGSSGVILGLLTAGCRVYGYGTGVGGCAAAG